MTRGEIWWADLPAPVGSGPGYRRPMLIVQGDAFNRSRIRTILAIALTTNLALGRMPGNVLLPAADSGLPNDSVAVVSQIVTVDRGEFDFKCGELDAMLMQQVDAGLRLILSL